MSQMMFSILRTGIGRLMGRDRVVHHVDMGHVEVVVRAPAIEAVKLAVFPQFLAGVAVVVAVLGHAELVRVRVDALRAGRRLDLPSERALQDLGGRQLVEDDVA